MYGPYSNSRPSCCVSLRIPYISARLDVATSASIYYCFCAFLRCPYRMGHRVYANFSFQLCQHVNAHLFKVSFFLFLILCSVGPNEHVMMIIINLKGGWLFVWRSRSEVGICEFGLIGANVLKWLMVAQKLNTVRGGTLWKIFNSAVMP